MRRVLRLLGVIALGACTGAIGDGNQDDLSPATVALLAGNAGGAFKTLDKFGTEKYGAGPLPGLV